MGERTSYTPGTFCWVDLVVEDPNAAKDYYAGLFGWEYDEQPSYSVAAIAPLPEPSMTPHWNCYVSVEDADAAVARAEALGATVVLAAGDAGESGRLAAFQDPQGAILSVWQPGRHFGAAVVNGPGALSWNDLLTPDVEASAAFYRELFGWEMTAVEGAPGERVTIRNGGRLNGGMALLPERAGAPPHWLPYFVVADLEASAARVGDGGGRVQLGPLEIPAGRFAICIDPQGAAFAIFAGEVED
jgi:uncharacterized protein